MKKLCALFLLTLTLIVPATTKAEHTFVFTSQDNSLPNVYIEQPEGWDYEESQKWDAVFVDPKEDGRAFAVHFFLDDSFEMTNTSQIIEYIDWLCQDKYPNKREFSIIGNVDSFVCKFIGQKENIETYCQLVVVFVDKRIVFSILNTNHYGFENSRDDYLKLSNNLAWEYRA